MGWTIFSKSRASSATRPPNCSGAAEERLRGRRRNRRSRGGSLAWNALCRSSAADDKCWLPNNQPCFRDRGDHLTMPAGQFSRQNMRPKGKTRESISGAEPRPYSARQLSRRTGKTALPYPRPTLFAAAGAPWRATASAADGRGVFIRTPGVLSMNSTPPSLSIRSTTAMSSIGG
jgi:hypothetical protein